MNQNQYMYQQQTFSHIPQVKPDFPSFQNNQQQQSFVQNQHVNPVFSPNQQQHQFIPIPQVQKDFPPIQNNPPQPFVQNQQVKPIFSPFQNNQQQQQQFVPIPQVQKDFPPNQQEPFIQIPQPKPVFSPNPNQQQPQIPQIKKDFPSFQNNPPSFIQIPSIQKDVSPQQNKQHFDSSPFTPSIIKKFSSEHLMEYPHCISATSNVLSPLNQFKHPGNRNEKYIELTETDGMKHHEILGMIAGFLNLKCKQIEKKQTKIDKLKTEVENKKKERKELIDLINTKYKKHRQH